jgi:nucleotide-binding universal stress UspA family protein
MYRNVLVPVDLSKKGAVAVAAATDVADPKEASITLLHVIETLQDVEYDELEAFYQRIKEKAEKTLGDWTAELSGRGFEAGAEIVFGRRGPEILRYADERNVDLIVMASHALDRANPTERFGTLSHQLAALSRCSVLLAR